MLDYNGILKCPLWQQNMQVGRTIRHVRGDKVLSPRILLLVNAQTLGRRDIGN